MHKKRDKDTPQDTFPETMKLCLCYVAAISFATTQPTSAFLARPDAHFSRARRNQPERSSFVYHQHATLYISDHRQCFTTPRLNLSKSDDDNEEEDDDDDDAPG